MGNFFGLVPASEKQSKENVFVPGLRNLGNNCFLNVILQALASCVSFRIFLKSNIERLESSLVEKEVDGFPLLVSLAALLDDLCTLQERRVTLSPLEVMSAMKLYKSHFDLTEQQVNGCTVEDCMKRFLAAERVEYDCRHCWHVGAMKYLSLVDGHEQERDKLAGCNELDSCKCRNMSCLEAYPWSDRFSHIFQQPTISCYPKILCLQLLRTVNAFGDLIKLQGHCSFQLLMNLSRFANDRVGIQHREEHINRRQAKSQNQPFISFPNHVDSSCCGINLKETNKDHTRPSELDENIVKSTAMASEDTCGQFQALNEVECESSPADGPMYHLVSVVEHFGRAGNGHYTVYRGVVEEVADGNNDGRCNDHHLRWFSISDSEVSPALEEDVLAAEAALLFYERLS